MTQDSFCHTTGSCKMIAIMPRFYGRCLVAVAATSYILGFPKCVPTCVRVSCLNLPEQPTQSQHQPGKVKGVLTCVEVRHVVEGPPACGHHPAATCCKGGRVDGAVLQKQALHQRIAQAINLNTQPTAATPLSSIAPCRQ